MSNKDDEIINNVILEMKKLQEEKEARKKAEKEANKKPRDLKYASNWQKGYIEKEITSGKTPVHLFIENKYLQLVDKEIRENSNTFRRLARKDIVNKALEYYFTNREEK